MTRLLTWFAVPTALSPSTASRFRRALPIIACSLLLALLMSPQTASAQTESILYNFKGGTTDGLFPESNLIFDSSGNLYGTTYEGGSSNKGTAFELLPSGGSWTESVLYNFTGTSLDGSYPVSGLLLDSAGVLWGTTTAGGTTGASCPSGCGTFFRLVQSGGSWSETGSFLFLGGGSGNYPFNVGNLIEDSSGNFYGTLNVGGTHNQGGVFQMQISGLFAVETVLHDFYNNTGNLGGEFPYGSLVMDSSGNLYGTAYEGGTNAYGVVFELSSGGTYTILHSFGAVGDGKYPYAGLIFDSSGNLYGTTIYGGANGYGSVFELSPDGSGGWNENTIYSFAGGTTDGYQPYGGVIMDSSGNLWGTTKYGGAHSYGTVYELSLSGGTWSEAELYSFKGGATDGGYPLAGLTLDSSGNVYGTTYYYGSHTAGVAFKIVP